METKLFTTTTTKRLKKTELEEVTSALSLGELVAFPTETVYGLGADATNSNAIEKIYLAKGRPSDNPLIVHVASFNQLKKLVKSVPLYVEKLINEFSPGPITYILEHNHTCSEKVTAGLSTIAVRIPNHPTALHILESIDFPIAAPSANLSGKPSPTKAEHVLTDLDGRLPIIIDGGATGVGLESTVLDCTGEVPSVLRHGSIAEEDIKRMLKIDVLQKNTENNSAPKSPGMKYKHYAPSIPLILVTGNLDKLKEVIMYYEELEKNIGYLVSHSTAKKLGATHAFNLGKTIEEIAGNIYEGLRSFEGQDYDIIICESFPQGGLGTAVMDRLTRAATEKI